MKKRKLPKKRQLPFFADVIRLAISCGGWYNETYE